MRSVSAKKPFVVALRNRSAVACGAKIRPYREGRQYLPKGRGRDRHSGSTHKHKTGAFLLLLFLLTGASPVFAQTVVTASPVTDGWGTWRTLTTEHFTIHFPRGRETYARRAAKLFERVHSRLAPHYVRSWKTYKTSVGLIFSSDLVQGWATTVGINQIVLYVEAPQLGNFSRYAEWLELLFTHEYTHILSLQIWDPSRFFMFLFRIVTGVPPNFLSPTAFVEGVAVWEESQSGLGRLEDPLSRMMVRTAVLENTYPSLPELLNSSHRWPVGRVPYLYGGRFMDELARQKGAAAPRSYWASDIFLPALIDNRLGRLGTSAWGVYRSLLERDTKQFRYEITSLRKKGLTPYERLSFDGFQKSFLIYNDQEGLIYYANPANDISGVYRLSADGQRQRIRTQISNRGIAWAGGRRFYSSDHILYPAFGIRQELHDGNRLYPFSRLAPGRSISYPALSSNARWLYFIEKKEDYRLLKSIRLQDTSGLPSEKESIILRVPYEGLLQYTALSADKRYLATIFREGAEGFGKLVLCHLAQGPAKSCRVLLQARAILAQPCFSQDGQKLFFTSDVDGIYNLYAVHLRSGVVHRLTHTLGGFFYPAAGKENLYSIAYFKNGYDLVRIAYKDLLQKKVDFFKPGAPLLLDREVAQGEKAEEPLPFPKKGDREDDESQASEFSEEGYYGPLLWLPYYTGLLGFGSTSGLAYLYGGLEARDPLEWHILGASLGIFDQSEPDKENSYESQTSFPGALYYTYNRYKAGLSLSYITDIDFTENGGAYLTYIDPGRFISFQTLAGYEYQKSFEFLDPNTVSEAESGSNFVRKMVLGGPSLILLMGNTHFFLNSISPELGWRFILQSSYYLAENSTLRNYDGNSFVGEQDLEYGFVEGGLALYLPSFFRNHVNYLSVYGYHYFGPSQKLRYQRQGNLVRNLDPAVPQGSDFIVYTYEYRFPLLWYSRPILTSFRSLALRYLSLAPFYDYGIATDRPNAREYHSWAYGFRLGFGIDLAYVSLPELQFSVSEGKSGETLYSFSISGTIGETRRAAYRERVTEPYRHPIPQTRQEPAYFRNPASGGYLE